MTFHDEIVKLQGLAAAGEARLQALEDHLFPPASAVDQTPITEEYLDTLSVEAIGELYKGKRIDEATLGAAITRHFWPAPKPEVVAAAPVAETPAPLDDAQIEAQNAHDRETGNVNEAGQTPAEAVAAEATEAEAAAPTAKAKRVAKAKGTPVAIKDEGLES